MSRKLSRLITVIGFAGVGKTALIRKAIYYVHERGLVKGGTIYVNANHIVSSESFIGILVDQIIQSHSFGEPARDADRSSFDILNLILTKICFLNEPVIFVFDNIEDLIVNHYQHLKSIITTVLLRVPKSKVLLVSRVRFNSI